MQQDVEWDWGDGQARALERLKHAVTTMSVLIYYSLDDEVTM